MIDDILREVERDALPDAAARVTSLATDYLAATRRGEGAVSLTVQRDEVDARFAEPMPEDGRPLADVVDRIRDDIIADANHLAHPMYMGHQVSFALPVAAWVDGVISALNQSIAVEEMSPTLTALETRVVRWMCDAAGLPAASGGTFTSGGTEATFTALLAARAAALPDSWVEGVSDRAPVVLCGEHTHYAVTRAVAQLGLGMQSAIAIPSERYRMNPDALERELVRLSAAGTRVMAVVATAGHTATGAFDDLDRIGHLCDARGIWLHVDGAHGASALLSDRHRHRVRGIERARSIAWDPHKMMLLPLPAGMVLVRDERELQAAFAQRAPYLFHGDAGDAGRARVRDQGVRSFQCSRRGDVLKVWAVLQRYGRRGIAALHDHLCDLALAMYQTLSAREDFVTLHEPESNILCFRWVGASDGRPDEDTLDAINGEVRARYNQSGIGWITTTVLEGRRVLRVTMMNPRTTVVHVKAAVDELARVANAITRTGVVNAR
ncbi:MAG TPA: aspartate aminotransferase family protein [Gemmatimonadaceae bacterium]|jgi:L-2,4-diaminobutyrate decarboxylase|nr:aspartate aminotransferase family protein [Gemmatimonadaceae bacterium]